MIGKREEAEGGRRQQLSGGGECRLRRRGFRMLGAWVPFHSDDVVGLGPVGRVRDDETLNEAG
jgi:hypothetical protein